MQLYLQNLGIDQSPSTILTPFVPRGPIREPEFSPTDLCTIKGSIGTPTKSTQTSEGTMIVNFPLNSVFFSLLLKRPMCLKGGSPNKGEFSGCSVMSVDSSISIAFSLDSLGPGGSIPEQLVQPSTLDPGEMQNQLPSSPQPDEDSYPSTLQTTLQQQRDSSLTSSQNTIQTGDRFDSDISSTEGRESSESPFRSTREEFAGTSFVSSRLMETLQTQAENVLSAGSVRRTEPEGCSAAPQDNTAPSQPAPTASSAPGLQQLPPPAVMAADTAEETQAAAAESPGHDFTSPRLKEDNDQGVMSDGSSRSSLAVKVTKLLQTESPNTLVSSTSSTTDQEERQARGR